MQSIVLFPDTNIFLQCKILRELPWGEFADVDEITLMVGAPVQDEIDRLKQDGNQRRARRAREANGLFREVLDSPNEALVIRESDPRVLLRFAPELPPDRATPKTLDRSRADDSLISEVLFYRDQDASAMILSGDIGIRLRAKRHTVPVYPVTDAWSLPPENDGRDKEIRSLQMEIAKLQKAEPLFKLLVKDRDGNHIELVSSQLPYYPGLTDEQLEALLESVKRRFPKALDFDLNPPPHIPWREARQEALPVIHEWHAPTTQEIEKYREDYESWIGSVRSRFERLPFLRNMSSRILMLQLELKNLGTRPADEVLFELTSRNGIKLFISADEKVPKFIRQLSQLAASAVFDSPPTAPKGKYVKQDLFGGLFRPESLSIGHFDPELHSRFVTTPHTPVFSRDRHVFYRQDTKSREHTHSSFTRKEFRHQSDPQIFRVWLIVPPDITATRSHLYCRISASNLSSPVNMRIPLDFQYEARDTFDLASSWKIETDPKAKLATTDD